MYVRVSLMIIAGDNSKSFRDIFGSTFCAITFRLGMRHVSGTKTDLNRCPDIGPLIQNWTTIDESHEMFPWSFHEDYGKLNP